MSKTKTAKQAKIDADIWNRVKKTSFQIFLAVLIAIYPLFLQVADLGDWSQLKAMLPVIGTTAVGAIITYAQNKYRASKGIDL